MSDPTKRKRGRPFGPAKLIADIHLWLPQELIDRVDAQRGEVPRVAVMRALLEAWVAQQEAAHAPRQ